MILQPLLRLLHFCSFIQFVLLVFIHCVKCCLEPYCAACLSQLDTEHFGHEQTALLLGQEKIQSWLVLVQLM
uniref:Putative secreted protein n=1 Tax=Amblyomma triste TaxID=251400 RepID=A0A023G0P3_AMBTT